MPTEGENGRQMVEVVLQNKFNAPLIDKYFMNINWVERWLSLRLVHNTICVSIDSS